MQLLMSGAIAMLLISVGMSLKWREMIALLQRPRPIFWLLLTVATLLVPPAVALLLARIFVLDKASLVGLFLIGVAPGAPLMVRQASSKRLDSRVAALYQVCGALATPVLVPLIVRFAGSLYGRDIRVEPERLLLKIAQVELLPLTIGMALLHVAPAFCDRVKRPLNLAGNTLMYALILGVVIKMGPALLQVNPLALVAAFLLAGASIIGVKLLLPRAQPVVIRTLALCNANRYPGLAILMSGLYFHLEAAVPVIASYVIVSNIAAALLAPWFREPVEATE
jgi:BASS family bile acid:Na+ symporter